MGTDTYWKKSLIKLTGFKDFMYNKRISRSDYPWASLIIADYMCCRRMEGNIRVRLGRQRCLFGSESIVCLLKTIKSLQTEARVLLFNLQLLLLR